MDPALPEAEAPPPRRRWKKVLLIVGGIFAGLVLLILILVPPIVSAVGKSKAEEILGESLNARVTVGKVSFGWSGRIEVEDVKVVPKEFSSSLLELKKLDVNLSLGSALAGKYIATVDVVSPRIVVERNAQGRVNYEVSSAVPPSEKLQEKPAKKPEAPAKKPFVQATIHVRDGQVVVREGGRETIYQNIALEAKVDTLEKPIDYRLVLEDPMGGKISGNGAFDIDHYSGPVTLALEHVSLKNMAGAARLYGNIVDLSGTIDGTFDYEMKGPLQFKGKSKVEGANLTLVLPDKEKNKVIKLDRVTLTEEGTLDEKGNGRHVLELTSGKAVGLSVVMDITDAFGTPGVTARLKADSDLAALGEALRSLIDLKQDVRLEGAAALSGDVEKKGDVAKFKLDAAVKDLVAVEKTRYEIDKNVTLKTAGAWNAATKSLKLDELNLGSSFATAEVRGGFSQGPPMKVANSTLNLEADLERLVAKLSNFIENPPALGGKATIKAKVEGDRAEVDMALIGLKLEKIGPLDATVHDEGTLDDKGNGRHTIRIDSGKALSATVVAVLKNLFADERVVSADITLDSELGDLSAMLPGLLELKPGAQPAGHARLGGKVEARGSTVAVFDVALNLTDLATVEKGRRQEVEKALNLKAKGSWDGAKSALDLEAFALESSFATADAKGGFAVAPSVAVKESDLQLNADLEKLAAKLAFVTPEPPRLSGTLEVKAKYAGERYDLDAVVKAFTSTTKKEGKDVVTGPLDARLVQKGVFQAWPGGALKIEASKLTSAAADAEVTGEIRSVMEEKREGDLKLDLALRPAELSKWIPDLNLGGPEIRLGTAVVMKPNQMTVKGQTKLEGLTRKDPVTGFLQTARAQPLDFSVEMKGDKIIATAKTALFEWIDKGYSAKGSLDTDGIITLGVRSVLSGKDTIGNLEISDGKNVVKDPKVEVEYDVELAPLVYDIRTARIASTFIRGSLVGRIRNPEKQPELEQIRGKFEYVPDRLGAVLAPWLPGKLEGAEWKDLVFDIDGKALGTDLLAILRGTRGTMDVDLAKFTTTGISVSGKTKLELKDSVVASNTPLSVNQGQTMLDARVDFHEASKKPRSALSFNARDVAANAQMGPLLAKINPIFYTQKIGGTVDGKINSDFKLDWEGPVDPDEKDWVAAATRSLRGNGSIAVKNLSIEGSPTVAAIMSALGEGSRIQGELIGDNLQVGGGRVKYQNMLLRLQKYELKFSGWVGFDQKMELKVEMPMTEHMMRQYKGLAKYMGQTIAVDLKGTVDDPKLDWKQMLEDMAKRALESEIKDKGKNLLEDLLKKKKK